MPMVKVHLKFGEYFDKLIIFVYAKRFNIITADQRRGHTF
jgi:hypothetical protein